MENASKALIIAGAILLSILLISLGIMVYTNAKGTIGEANLDSEEIQTFNTKILQYCGKNKSADDMNNLISAISASNGAQSKAANPHYIYVTLEPNTDFNGYYSGDSDINEGSLKNAPISYPRIFQGIKCMALYETDADGYIKQVTIKKQK